MSSQYGREGGGLGEFLAELDQVDVLVRAARGGVRAPRGGAAERVSEDAHLCPISTG